MNVVIRGDVHSIRMSIRWYADNYVRYRLDFQHESTLA